MTKDIWLLIKQDITNFISEMKFRLISSDVLSLFFHFRKFIFQRVNTREQIIAVCYIQNIPFLNPSNAYFSIESLVLKYIHILFCPLPFHLQMNNFSFVVPYSTGLSKVGLLIPQKHNCTVVGAERFLPNFCNVLSCIFFLSNTAHTT